MKLNKRKIKFRVWDKKRKIMLPFKDIYLSEGEWSVWDREDSLQDEDLEIMQFTGLLDKNGKEIYEGDIITNLSKAEKAIVEWKHDGYMCLMHPEKRIVIGNIYENPFNLNIKWN